MENLRKIKNPMIYTEALINAVKLIVINKSQFKLT